MARSRVKTNAPLNKGAKKSASNQLLSGRDRLVVWFLGLFGIEVKSPQFAGDVAVRGLMTIFALVGVGITAYLTYIGFADAEIACTSSTDGGSSGCSAIQQTSWSTVGAVPLALFGLIGYVVMVVLATAPLLIQRVRPERDWLLYSGMALVFVAVSMAIFSIYLMIGLWFRLDVTGTCVFCLTSAIMTLLLAGGAVFSYNWQNLTPMFGLSAAALVLTLVVALPTFTVPNMADDGRIIVGAGIGNPDPGIGWDIRGESGEAEIALAEHLVGLGDNAVKFGAWWCPHCHTQKELFGAEAFNTFARYDNPAVGYVECANNDRSTSPPTPQCAPAAQAGLVQAFPTWIINGQVLTGAQNLENLADAAGYTGPRDFRFTQG